MAVQSIAPVGVAAGQAAGAKVFRFADRVARASRRSSASIRSLALQALGLAAIDYAMFQWTQIAGFVAVGVSFFALDYITGGAGEKGDGNGGEVAR